MANAMRSYVAECFWPGVNDEHLTELADRAEQATSAGSGLAQVRYRGLLLMREDEVVLCFFEGPSAAAVKTVARAARVPFARIVESTPRPATAPPAAPTVHTQGGDDHAPEDA
jgi:hypothetical protein